MATRGAYAKGIAKRDEILTVALDLVARQGFHHTSVRDIADAVGLTQPGLLHYFDSKDALWVAILRHRDDYDGTRLRSTPDVLAALVDLVRRNASIPGLVEMWVNLSAAAATDRSHPAHAYFRERYERIRRELAANILAGQKLGRYRDDIEADRFAASLLALADGMQLQWLLDPTLDMASGIERIVQLALRADDRE